MNDSINRQQALDTIRNIRAITGTFDDKILLIDKAEAQTKLMMLPSAEPEIIHCKNCKHRESNDCPMYYEEWIEIDEGDGYFDTDNIIHDWTTDEGFCHCAELRSEEDE